MHITLAQGVDWWYNHSIVFNSPLVSIEELVILGHFLDREKDSDGSDFTLGHWSLVYIIEHFNLRYLHFELLPSDHLNLIIILFLFQYILQSWQRHKGSKE